MRTNQIYVGIKGSVLALDRDSGRILWSTNVKGSSFVTVVDDGPRVFALSHGETYCLDAGTGTVIWHNPLKGCGIGIGSIAVPGRPVSAGAGAAHLVAEQQGAAAASSTAGRAG